LRWLKVQVVAEEFLELDRIDRARFSEIDNWMRLPQMTAATASSLVFAIGSAIKPRACAKCLVDLAYCAALATLR
jgi:hypothetical protein